jgi:Carboxypeptidase regulatory-like domain
MRRATALILVLVTTVVIGGYQPPPPPPPPDPTLVQPGTAVIRGRVVAASTGDPLRNARVAILGTANTVVRPVLTDGDGRFALTRVPAGAHQITAIKTGYAEARFGARGSGPALRVEVAAGAIVNGIDIHLARSGAISGRVVDDAGDPLPNSTVSAERLVRVDGRLDTRPVATAQTDDLGEYRLFGLPAGRFVVGVTSTGMDSLQNTPGFTDVVWSRSFYPGVPSLAQAQPVTIAPGADVPGIDFTSAPTRRPSLSTTVVDPNGEPTDAQVTFGSESRLGSTSVRMGITPTRNTTVARLEPGTWVVLAVGSKGVGMTRVTLGGDDEATTITMTRGGRLSGRVVTDGSPLPASAIVDIEAASADPALATAGIFLRSRRIEADGTFVLTNLLGPRQLRLRAGPKGWVLKDVVSQGRSLLDVPLVFSGSETITDVEVILSNHQSTLTGNVTTADGREAVADYSVLVFPSDPARLRNTERWARWARPRLRGDFAIDDLLPGDYLAVAVVDVDDTQWQNADYLERFRSRATPVTLGDRESKHVVLELVPES